VARAVGVKLPLTPYAHPDLSPAGADLAMRYYHSMYFPTPARAANLATGVLLALVMLDAKATAALKRHRWAVLLACAAALGVFGRLVLASKLYGTPKEEVNWPNAAMFAALAYHGSPLYCAAAAAVVLGLALHVGPGFTAAAKVLASGPMHLLSKVRIK